MKQIFDWLREQIKESRMVVELKTPKKNLDVIGFYTMENIINEAEAKWESECCIWKKNIYFFGGHDYSSGCGTRIPLNSLEYHKYCPFCGKPIKISEVE